MPIEPSSAIALSLQVALWCTVAGFPVALGLGWVLARKQFVGRSVLATFVLAPLVLPPVVTGYLLLQLLGRSGPLSIFSIPFTLAAAVVAAGIVGLPLYVMSIRGAFESIDRRYEEVALSLGIRPIQTFRRITLPLAVPGIVAGGVLAFARALGEFGATAVLAGNIEGETRTIPLAVYTLLESPSGAEGARILVAASLLLSFSAIFGYEFFNRWQRRRLELHHDH